MQSLNCVICKGSGRKIFPLVNPTACSFVPLRRGRNCFQFFAHMETWKKKKNPGTITFLKRGVELSFSLPFYLCKINLGMVFTRTWYLRHDTCLRHFRGIGTLSIWKKNCCNCNSWQWNCAAVCSRFVQAEINCKSKIKCSPCWLTEIDITY